jgi:hypothetical protein
MGDATAALEGFRFDGSQLRSTTEPKLARHRPGMNTGWQTVAATTSRGLSFMLRDTPPQEGVKNDAE